jgi:hypothetical protein
LLKIAEFFGIRFSYSDKSDLVQKSFSELLVKLLAKALDI